MTSLASPHPNRPVSAVLLSGGLDSVVLLAEEAARGGEIYPLYVSVGLAWEAAERHALRALLTAVTFGDLVRPLANLSVDMRDVYPPAHWAIAGSPPGYHTADEAVYLHGRNIVLLGKAAVFCATVGVTRIVMGTLGHNPFPDATPEFRDAMAKALSLGLDHRLRIEAPYAGASKAEVVRRGSELGVPLELTLSCMNPIDRPRAAFERIARHCGACSKCRERHDAFVDAGIPDPTRYDDRSFVESRSGTINS